jgi:Protein of unknown function (DUF3592)
MINLMPTLFDPPTKLQGTRVIRRGPAARLAILAAMPSLGPRLIAYGLIGIFCVPGPLGLLFAVNLILHRAAFIHSALRTDGTVIWMEPVRTTRTGAGTYIPVFRFTAIDDRLHIVNSDVSVASSTFNRGDRVRVLYLQSNPEIARIEAFSTLWQTSLVVGIWGAVWSFIPALILVMRRRRPASSEFTLPPEP